MLDLLIPELLLADAPGALDGLRLPAMERWLARANAARRPERSAGAVLAARFGLAEPAPMAAVALAADGGAREGTWLRADPVHLRVQQDDLALQHGATLEVTPEESEALLGEVRRLFRDDGLEFHAAAPDRWYVKVPEGEVPRTVPIEEAIGRNVFGMLPRGPGRINWPSAMTEVQMLFSTHEVNARREAEGRPAINSLWFWGEGQAPAKVTPRYARVYAGDPFARGLAALAGVAASRTPAGIADVETAGQGAVLVVHEAPSQALRRGDEAAWKAAAEALDRDWFAPMANAIGRFGTVRVLMPTGHDTFEATLTASARWRVFRAARPIARHA